MEKRKQGMKTGDTAAVFHCTFGALPEVQFLRSTYHFKAQKVKNPTIQTISGWEVKRESPRYTQPGQAPLQASNLKQAIMNLSKNPKGIYEVEAQEGESLQVREVKVVITLRSGKEVDLPIAKIEHKLESEAEKEKGEEIKGKRKGNSVKNEDLESTVDEEPERTINQEDMMKKHTPPPFSQALHGKKGINNA
ncbi:hypothetical protein CK203_060470 [Vitis vinifera]|uniref:Uncharacterized protein n=1 Tax=Vitis vinifera TaxID=29760 RepID=A0A438GJN7_VITVI|nr:hypothetical protein CK203_060470 [Vitis vinifera]